MSDKKGGKVQALVSSSFGGWKKRTSLLVRYFLQKPIRLLILILFIFVLPIFVFLVQKQINYLRSRAAAGLGEAEFTFSPSSTSLPPGASGTFSLRVDTAGVTFGFVRAEVIFDNTKLRLTGTVNTSNRLRWGVNGETFILKTPITEANNSGRMVIVLGLHPSDRSNPPSGTSNLPMEIAQLTFQNIVPQTQTNVSSQVRVDTSAQCANNSSVSCTQDSQCPGSYCKPRSQVVRMNEQAIAIQSLKQVPANLTLNPSSCNLPGDVTGPQGVKDCRVDMADVNLVLTYYGCPGRASGNCSGYNVADISGSSGSPDNQVNMADVNLVLTYYGCPGRASGGCP